MQKRQPEGKQRSLQICLRLPDWTISRAREDPLADLGPKRRESGGLSVEPRGAPIFRLSQLKSKDRRPVAVAPVGDHVTKKTKKLDWKQPTQSISNEACRPPGARRNSVVLPPVGIQGITPFWA